MLKQIKKNFVFFLFLLLISLPVRGQDSGEKEVDQNPGPLKEEIKKNLEVIEEEEKIGKPEEREEEVEEQPEKFLPSETEKVETKEEISDDKKEEIALPENKSGNQVEGNLKEADEFQAGLFKKGPINLVHKKWRAFKRSLNSLYGLDFGIAYTILYQHANPSDFGPNKAAVGDFDLFGKWKAPREELHLLGTVGFYAEYRGAFSDITPSALADSIGSLWGTTDGFNRQDFSLVQLWWQESLWENRVVFTVGKIDLYNHFNSNQIAASANESFLNQAFSTNPTNPSPPNGLGASLLVQPWEFFYLSVGFGNVNAEKTSIDPSTVSRGEFYIVSELGIRPDFEGIGKGTYRFTYWDTDENRLEEKPSAQGFALSFDQNLGKYIVLFLRYGFGNNDIEATRQILSAGGGFKNLFGLNKGDFFGAAAGWGQPSDRVLRDQYVAEIYYRFQLTPIFSLTPDVQWIVHPSKNPFRDYVSVFGFRARLVF